MDLRLAGLKAIVTGGTRGIGRATVELLAEEGTDVVFCARTEEDVKATADALSGLKGSVQGYTVDVADAEALSLWVRGAAQQLGGLDVVVANVSALAVGPTEDHWRAGYQVDLMHTVRTIEAAMPFLAHSESPSIVGVASTAAREIDFEAPAYGTMKAAIVHYLQTLAFHLADTGIRANTVSPGNTYSEGGSWQQIEESNPALYAESVARNPTGRMARPDEVAYAIAMLASPRASFITGTNLVVDGALTRGVQL